MRVNNINGTLNFKRIIPINYTRLNQAKRIHGVDEALIELEDILNSNEPFHYSKAESAKIREFFDRKIEDYNGKKGVLIVKTNDGAALLTGKDAKHIKNIKSSDKDGKTTARIISQKIEDGQSGKPDAKFVLISKARQDAVKSGKTLPSKEISRFDAIRYIYEYHSTCQEKFETLSSDRVLSARATAIYDNDELKI